MNYFSINGQDFSEYVDINSYSVNHEDIYTEWVDGNHITHRDIIRKRITGSFSLGFINGIGVADFLTALSSDIHQGGWYPVEIRTMDDDTVHSANVFLVISAGIKRDQVNNRSWHEYTIEVEER